MTKAKERREPKITPEMIEAGIMAFRRHVSDDTPLVQTQEEIVVEILQAMLCASSVSPKF